MSVNAKNVSEIINNAAATSVSVFNAGNNGSNIGVSSSSSSSSNSSNNHPLNGNVSAINNGPNIGMEDDNAADWEVIGARDRRDSKEGSEVSETISQQSNNHAVQVARNMFNLEEQNQKLQEALSIEKAARKRAEEALVLQSASSAQQVTQLQTQNTAQAQQLAQGTVLLEEVQRKVGEERQAREASERREAAQRAAGEKLRQENNAAEILRLQALEILKQKQQNAVNKITACGYMSAHQALQFVFSLAAQDIDTYVDFEVKIQKLAAKVMNSGHLSGPQALNYVRALSAQTIEDFTQSPDLMYI